MISGKKISWLIGNRIIWIFVAAMPAILTGQAVFLESKFYFYSSLQTGTIVSSGVILEGIGASDSRGSWTRIQPFPWVDIKFSDDGNQKVCHIQGQLGMFGDWISDSKNIIENELKKINSTKNVTVYVLRKDSSNFYCRMKRTVDSYLIFIFLVSLIVSLIVVYWTVESIRLIKTGSDDFE